ncbi:MAG TPA: lipoprotein-releasing ABC transporter permease subunit [Thiothrix sp.]|nr:lipoprotein-releasing ABC transporter permease subunit [Thiothrix sp.]
MFKPLDVFIGLRYTRSRRQGAYVSFIALASMIGIALSVLVLITVLSIMNGFEQAFRERVLGMASHVTVSAENNEIFAWQEMRETLLSFPHVTGIAPFIDKQVMLNMNGEVRGASLQGILPEYQQTVGTIEQHMTGHFEDLKAGEYGIILGQTLAEELGLKVGDDVTSMSLRNLSLDGGELPILKEFKVLGTFKLDMKLFDSTMAFIHLQDAADMLEMDQRVSGLRLQLDDMNQAPAVSAIIYDSATPGTWIIDWTRQYRPFFKALQTQKTMFFFILVMLVAVAAFNLVSTMVMMVTDKDGDIAILRTQGLSPSKVTRIFMVQGSLIGVIGTFFGVVFGVLLSLNIEIIVPIIERLLGMPLMSEDGFFINKIKGAIEIGDIILIAGSTLLLSLLATLYPSWKASKVQPAESLRYE